MANGPVAGQAAITLYPDLQNFAGELLGAINRVVSQVAGEGQMIGHELATSINDSILQNRPPEIPVDADISKFEQSLGTIEQGLQAVGDIGLKSVGTLASGVGRILSPAFSGAANILGDSIKTAGNMALGALGISAGAVIGQAVGGGLSRAMSLNQAEASLKAVGYEGQQLEKVMDSAMAGVEGTSFMLADAAAASTSFLTAGIEEGDELVGILRTVSNTAAQAGAPYGEMANIFQKAATRGKVMGDTLAQFNERNIPATRILADEFGKTTEEIEKMASSGEISFDMLSAAFADSDLVASAEEMAKIDFGAGLSNVRAYLGYLTEPMWTAGIEGMIPIFQTLQQGLIDFMGDNWVDRLSPAIDKISGGLESVDKWLQNLDWEGGWDKMTGAVEKFGSAIAPLSGLLVGFSGSLLQRIPIIGGMFAGLSAPVGLMIGSFIGAYQASDDLQDSFSGLWDSLKDLAGSVLEVFTGMEGSDDVFGAFFENIGDRIAVGIDTITGFIEDSTPKIQGFFETLTGGDASLGDLTIFDSIRTVFEGIVDAITSDGVANAVSDLISNLSQSTGSIGEALSGLFDTGGLQGEASTLEKVLVGSIDIINVLVDVVEGVITGFAGIIDSPIVQGLLDFIGGIVGAMSSGGDDFISAGELLGRGLAAFAVVGVAMKAIGGIKVALGILAPLKALFGGVAAAGGIAAGTRLTSFLTGISTAIKVGGNALFSAMAPALKGILAITAIGAALIGAMALLGGILHIPGIREGIDELVDLLLTTLGDLIETIDPLLERVQTIITDVAVVVVAALAMVLDTIAENLPEIISAIGEAIEPIIDTVLGNLNEFAETLSGVLTGILGGIADIIDSLAGVISAGFDGVANVIYAVEDLIMTVVVGLIGVMDTFTNSAVTLMQELANNGAAAGSGAYALAGGLTALILAMSGGAVVGGLSNVAESGLNVLSSLGDGIANKLNPQEAQSSSRGLIDTIIDLGNALKDTNGIVENMPALWNRVANMAPASGALIMRGLVTGMESQGHLVSSAIRGSVQTGIQDAQQYANANPIQLRAYMNTPRMPAYAGSGSGDSSSGRRGRSGSTTNNFNVTSTRPEVVSRHLADILGR